MAFDPEAQAPFIAHEISWRNSARANASPPPFDTSSSDTQQGGPLDEVQEVARERRRWLSSALCRFPLLF
jgi:hypothetical protein